MTEPCPSAVTVLPALVVLATPPGLDDVALDELVAPEGAGGTGGVGEVLLPPALDDVGVTAVEAADSGPVPTAFVADTANV